MAVIKTPQQLQSYWAQKEKLALERVKIVMQGAMAEAMQETIYAGNQSKYYNRSGGMKENLLKFDIKPQRGKTTGYKIIGYGLRAYLDFNMIKPRIVRSGKKKDKQYFEEEERTKKKKVQDKERMALRRTKKYKAWQEKWKKSKDYAPTIKDRNVKKIGEWIETDQYKGVEYRRSQMWKSRYEHKKYKAFVRYRLNSYANFDGSTTWKGKPLTYWVPYWFEFGDKYEHGKQRSKIIKNKKVPIIGVRFPRTGFFTLFLSKLNKLDLNKQYVDALRKEGVKVIGGYNTQFKLQLGSWDKMQGSRVGRMIDTKLAE